MNIRDFKCGQSFTGLAECRARQGDHAYVCECSHHDAASFAVKV
jgi:hypothetical protein